MSKSKNIEKDLQSLLDGRRKFEIEFEEGVATQYFIGMPTADQVRKADWEHAKVYNRALKEGVLTESEMRTILKERSIISDDHDLLGQELRIKLAEKLIEMERENDKEKRSILALDAAKLREEFFQWNQSITGPMSSTCEHMANEARTEFLTSAILQDNDGKPVWESYEDYCEEGDLVLQSKARFEVMLWMQGVESDFLENTPENLVLREMLEQATEEAEAESVKELPPAEAKDSEPAAPAEKKTKRKKTTKKKKSSEKAEA